MNTFLWILQAILAIKFVFSAVTHGVVRSQEMREGITRMGLTQAQPLLAVVSLLLLVGGLGVIAPAVLRTVPWLASASAVLLAVLMMASLTMHPGCRSKQQLLASSVIFVLCMIVSTGRLSVFP